VKVERKWHKVYFLSRNYLKFQIFQQILDIIKTTVYTYRIRRTESLGLVASTIVNSRKKGLSKHLHIVSLSDLEHAIPWYEVFHEGQTRYDGNIPNPIHESGYVKVSVSIFYSVSPISMQLIQSANNFVNPLDEKNFWVTRATMNAPQYFTSSLVEKLTIFILPFKCPSTWKR